MTATRNSPQRREGWNEADKVPLSSQDMGARNQRPLVVGSLPILILSMIFFTLSLIVSFSTSLASTTKGEARSSTSHNVPNVLYGHVHIAKTAGTTINGNLSMHYERICGHKGYSYDAYTVNERFRTNTTHRYVGFHRGQVPQQVMNEIGYHDCDWVSLETQSWKEWLELFQNWSIPLELHVPCRSPVEHVMSQCNFLLRPFDCSKNGNAMIQQIDNCLKYVNERYNTILNETFSTKCFDSRKISEYMDWIGTRLQKRRIETDYFFRPTNAERIKNQECVWEHPDVQNVVETHLLETYDYYKFCDACLGSEQDLLFMAQDQ